MNRAALGGTSQLVENAFDLYLSRISPSATQAKAAQRSHNALRDYLSGDDYFGRMLVTSFLNGSYARRTAIRPIKDVDVIVVVGSDWMDETPSTAMESLRRKLAQRYDQRRTLRQRRAVRITLCDMQLDVLLAVAADGLSKPLYIPDRQQSRWIVTHPKRQLELVSGLAAATDGNYSRLVRLLKGWTTTRVAAEARPSSFVLECSAFHVLSQRPDSFSGSLAESFAELLAGLCQWNFGRGRSFFSWGPPEVSDPGLPNLNVAEKWDGGSADRYLGCLDRAVRRCGALERSRWEETEVDKWRDIFGEPFPPPMAASRWLIHRG
jgi:hypothetical protein